MRRPLKPIILIGADPEFGLVDTKAMRAASAHDIVPGTKDEPFKIRKGAIQADGCMVEFNINPADTADKFVGNIEGVLKSIRRRVSKKYEFNFSPVVKFDKFYFDKIPDDPKALGCTPDYNAWNNSSMNPTPVPANGNETMRTCSGHIHIGWTKGADVTNRSHLWDCELVIKALDNIILPFIKLWDHDTERAALYGKPGAYRPKPYGCEWRVPSNAWLNHPKVWPWLFEAITYVVNNLDKMPTYYHKNRCASARHTTPSQAHVDTLHKSMGALGMKDLPKFDVTWIGAEPVLNRKQKRAKKAAQIEVLSTGAPFIKVENGILTGFRVAHKASSVDYDLNLDVPYILGVNANYSNPSEILKGIPTNGTLSE